MNNLEVPGGTDTAPDERDVRKEGEKEQLYSRTRTKLRQELLSISRQDVLDKMKSESSPFWDATGQSAEEIAQRLDACVAIHDDDQFLDATLKTLEPFLYLQIENPRLYEDIQRDRILNRKGYVKVNDLFAYRIGEEGDWIHLHIFPVKERKDKLGLLHEGMKKLALAVERNEKIKEVTATSWIVASNPGLMRKLGFEIEGEIDEKTRQEHFSDEERRVAKATISREELLKRYLA